MRLRGSPPGGGPSWSYVNDPSGTIVGSAKKAIGRILPVPGSPGPRGPEGPQGETGPRGPKGDQGPQGERGPEGPQGDQGDGLEIVGQVPTYGDLPTSVPEGTAYLAGGKIYVYRDGAWPPESAGTQVQGDQGPKGDTGERGPEGPQGERGPQGEQGPRGLQGPKGDQGEQGIQGIQGPRGAAGASLDIEGTVATYGDLPSNPSPGDAWVVAADGLLYFFDGTSFPADGQGVPFVGPEGQQGIQGPQGERGPKGEQGVQGDQGPKGDQGERGPKGDTGPKGDPGDEDRKSVVVGK